jgi:hypothetical protein
MDSISPGQLVKVADGKRERDGIVFDTPSSAKVVVAVVDLRRGPAFRTVNAKTLSERLEEGPDDPALHRLLRRTRSPVHGEARDGPGSGRGLAGHSRAARHRTTGK